MPFVTLRTRSDAPAESDLTVEVKENTFEYLRTSPAPTIRVSAYLDRDWPQVEASYAELFVSEDCGFISTVTKITPGSRVRTGIQLPGPMQQGEQLIVEVSRKPVIPE